jgi:uncharacterized protein YkwD
MWVAMACAAPSAARTAEPVTPVPTKPSSPSRDFAKIESEVFVALNAARTRPATAATWLEQLVPRFSGNRLQRPGWPFAVQTVEGAAAVREAVSVLNRQAAVPALSLDAALTRAARDHASDQARTGSTGHTGSDGSSVTTRVARHGTWLISINENIDYQPMLSGRDVIESLLIDDGVRDRGHRRNIYETTSRMVGIACGPHPRYTATCVIVQAGGMSPR